MASASDHVRRDAEAYTRAMVKLHLDRFRRRIEETAKAEVKTALEEAAHSGKAVDGFDIGKVAADSAITAWIDQGPPKPAIEAPAGAVEAGQGEDGRGADASATEAAPRTGWLP